jgi:glucan phosphoethanolaminetransferase (alkaline phosphatase superfamily)
MTATIQDGIATVAVTENSDNNALVSSATLSRPFSLVSAMLLILLASFCYTVEDHRMSILIFIFACAITTVIYIYWWIYFSKLIHEIFEITITKTC